ncbi:MAG: phosphoribosylformimino-5-aminoimidazole carboxamide ribotide isomerase [Deltaproteobacteria bacterium]|nr:MAG: phosphoribosylformimino-5-aminoimidazole carboxamide ribotide isomerase [Deltaproteobacteria bacterium]PIE72974.1 MAG: phosphoribosylformimino-5-aminoimidazole carboxamide ribotide isomerase [Deltaproteobacteria bacterium]
MKFRPCIDLHSGVVKQIVGSTLSEDPSSLSVNFVSQKSPAWYASLFRKDNLLGGHVIMLGPGNAVAAREALAAWPEGMQIGGGITADNAKDWLDRGASHVIVTSYVFNDGNVDMQRLRHLVSLVGKEHIVLDLSCRKRGEHYYIVTDRWQCFTEVRLQEDVLEDLAGYCDQFLVHAADVEGKCAGIEPDILSLLARCSALPITYAGGVASIADLQMIADLGQGRVDVTVGSALDIFGGQGLTYREVVQFCAED